LAASSKIVPVRVTATPEIVCFTGWKARQFQ
jgi:hypothetical protein